MATPEQRALRRAQRETAQRVRASRQPGGKYQRVLPKSITGPSMRAQTAYATAVLEGREPYPTKGTAESKQLARMGSYSRWHKADARFLDAFQQYFYHDERNQEIEDE